MCESVNALAVTSGVTCCRSDYLLVGFEISKGTETASFQILLSFLGCKVLFYKYYN
jgi:hypothetical protein